MEAYVNGVSTRKMLRVVQELGLEGMDKSKVSRINKELDERVGKFLQRPLEDSYPLTPPSRRSERTGRFRAPLW